MFRCNWILAAMLTFWYAWHYLRSAVLLPLPKSRCFLCRSEVQQYTMCDQFYIPRYLKKLQGYCRFQLFWRSVLSTVREQIFALWKKRSLKLAILMKPMKHFAKNLQKWGRDHENALSWLFYWNWTLTASSRKRLQVFLRACCFRRLESFTLRRLRRLWGAFPFAWQVSSSRGRLGDCCTVHNDSRNCSCYSWYLRKSI